MDLAKRSCLTVFLISLAAMLLLPPLSPGVGIFYFAPFLITYFYQNSFLASTWIACGCGLIVDLLSDQRFGINATVYVLSTCIVYRQKQYFFPDRLLTLPIMVYIFTFVSTFLLGLMGYLERGEGFKLASIDLFYLPLMDFFYAFILFTVPPYLFRQRRRKGRAR
jgi:rod shape-determining protein MreD